MRRYSVFAFISGLLITVSSGLQIDCEFDIVNYELGDFYTCKARKLVVETENEAVEGVIGDHFHGKTNIDVRVLLVDDQNLTFFPLDVDNFFPNLKGLKVISSGLKVLTQDNLKWFPDLQFCIFDDNEIEILPDELFIYNSKLKRISFDSNKISLFGKNVLDVLNDLESVSFLKNKCIDESWTQRETIEEAKEKLAEKCESESRSALGILSHLKANSADTTKSLKDSVSEYLVRDVTVTRMVKITRHGSARQYNFGEKFESSDGSLEIACDIVESFWKYSNAELVTCNVQNEPIEFLGFRLTFPDGVGEDVRALSFNDNKKVNYLPENIAEAFPNLVELSAKNSFIETIPAKTFEGLGKLKKLDLSQNDMKIIENGAFAGLSGLEVLDLSEGSIGYVEEGAFADLTSLKTLHLGGNKLHYLLVNIFQGLTELRNVSLELNHLTDIDEALFSTNTKLVNIWLNKNQLNIISPKVFEGLTELAYIDLQGNECIDGVYDASTFEGMNIQMEEKCGSSYVVHRTFKKVKVSGGSTVGDENEMDDDTIMKVTQEAEIVLTNNLEKKTVSCVVEGSTCVISDQGIDDKDFKIKEVANSDDVLAFNMVNNKMTLFLPQNMSQILPNLVEISTENSSLVYLTRKNFHGLAHLKTLNLAKNNIKFIEPDAFDDLNELEELDLSGNGIEYIDENLFLKLRALKRLRLDDNKLHFIHPKLFRNLRNLQNISISSNSLSTLDGNLFKTNQKLKSVWLQGNNIKSASPNMFSSAKALESVDLRDNKCITAAYEKSSFETMKADILDKCGAGYVLLHGKKAKKNEPKKKKEKIKTTTEATDELKEVGCDYEDVYWPSLNKTLFTCVISEFDSITGPDYTMTANMPFALPFIEGELVQAVKFSNNKDVKFLPRNIGKVFPNLEMLSATGTSVSSIPKNAFKDLPKLRHLNLSGNQIKSIDPRAFKSLTSLEELILDDNEFEYIEVTTLTYLKKLRMLKMLGNKIKTFEPSMFEGLTELLDVSLELQDASQVPEDFFKSHPTIEHFTFNGKTFGPGFEFIEDSEDSTDGDPTTESSPEEATMLIEEDKNGALKEVECVLGELFSMATNENLFTCEINDEEDLSTYRIKFSPELRKVKRIIIANRKNVKSLPENLLEVFPKLMEISAENSGITELNRKALTGLKALKVIDLAGNSIKHIESDTFDDTDNLEMLDLSDNDMEFLEETLLYKLKYLKRLNIDGNRIHFIHSKTFKHLESIEEVTLSRNVLSIIELYTFRYNPKLRVVDISSNAIESLSPKTFANLKALTSIKLDGNKCIEGTFDPSTLDEMKNEISKSCNTKPSDEQATVTCAFDETDGSCMVSDQPIDSAEYSVVMKPNDGDASQEVKKLRFVGPDVKFLPKNIGKEFSQLEEISVENSRLNKISQENFVDLGKLKSLKLGSVESVEPDTFTELSNLENLEMEPEVEELDENLFAKLTSLKTLYLVSKSIRRMSPKAFNNLHGLIAIKLNFHQLGEPKEVQESLRNSNQKLKFIQINDETTTTEPLEADDVEFTNQFTAIPENSQQTGTTKVSCDYEAIVDENGTTRVVCNLKHQTIENDWTVVEESSDNQHVDWIDFSYNLDVKFLPANFTQSFPKATKITAKGTSIEKISPESFKGFENLEILDLSDNKINSVEPETFSDLKSLTDLDLSHNGISELDKNSFGSMPSLQTLNLNDNKLTTIDPTLFDKLPALKNLNLDGNPNLPQINEAELFKNNHELTNVKLSISNTLKPETTTASIETTRPGRPHESRKPTASSRRSTTIKPSRNFVVCQLAQMNWVDDGSLVTCDLSNQNIPDADTIVQSNPYTMHIQALKIENNKNARFLPENLAESFPNLQKLSARNSSLSGIFQDDFEHMKNLIAADFSGNNIETIEPETFSDLTSLEDLDLNSNQIEYVDEKAFYNLEKLRTLNLKNNKISLIHPKTFNRLPALTAVNLEGNNIQEKLKAELIRSNPSITFTFSYKPPAEEPHTTLATTTRRYPAKPKEVSCVYSETFWNFSSSELFTCNLKRAVEDMNIRIKTSPRNTRVRGLNVIDNKNVKFLPINLSEHFPKLIGISAHNSSLEAISPRNFEKLFDLKHLTLSKNNLKSIDPASFKDLQSLEELDLSDNELEQLDESTFDNLGSLKSLSLGGNKLRNLPANIFKNLHNLQNISLSNNLFSTINPSIFQNNLKLENVWLNGNRINHVDPQTFNRLLNLEYVDFRRNDCIDQYFEGSKPSQATHSTLHLMIFELSSKCKPEIVQTTPGNFRTDTKPSIPRPQSSKRPKTQKTSTQAREIPCKFKYIKSPQTNSILYTCIVVETSNPGDVMEETKNAFYVRAIEFRGKKIKSLPKNIARVFPNIINFLVRSTSLSKIDPQTLEGFSKLKTLSLPDNKLEVINFSDLTTLDSINLNHNRIKRVDGKSFPLSIKKIDLSNNLLDSIEPQAFGNLKDLKSLSVERNQITEVDGNSFKSNKMLEEILLGGNKITKMSPKAFQHLPMLNSVNLEGNPCVSGLYTPTSLKALSVDISRNCDPSYTTDVDTDENLFVDINRQPHIGRNYPEPTVENLQGTEDDDAPKRVDPETEVIYPEPKKVYCEFDETFSSFTNSPLYTCTVNDQKIDSDDFTFNPNPNNKRVKRMIFDSKKGPRYLPNDIGATFPNLVELMARNGSLKHVTPEDFEFMPKLKSLDLSANNINFIAPYSFDGLSSLEELSLSQNNIRTLDIPDMRSLKVLNLDDNELTSVDTTFSRLPHLTALNLGKNQLTSIDPQTFSNNAQLEVISINNNQLTTINPKTFANLSKLKALDLRQNECIDRVFGLDTIASVEGQLEENCHLRESFESKLSTCQRENEDLRMTSQMIKSSNARENEELKEKLYSHEMTISQLHRQIKENQEVVNAERQLARKLKEMTESLEVQLENLQSSCVHSTDKSLMVDIDCSFNEIGLLNDYSCDVQQSLNVPQENATIRNVRGDHKRGKRNADVTSLIVSDQSVKFIPSNIARHFPKLNELILVNSKLNKINKLAFRDLHRLMKIVIRGNNVNSIEPGSFDENLELEFIDLSSNNLQALPSKLFGFLPNLKVIHVNHNAIERLNADVMPIDNVVEDFSISDNKLKWIDPRFLKSLTNAQVVDFSNNNCVDHKHSSDGDQSIFALFGKIAVKCSDDSEMFCKAT